jgi:hypothetical protein
MYMAEGFPSEYSNPMSKPCEFCNGLGYRLVKGVSDGKGDEKLKGEK